jgi:hypothetical protein
VSPDCGIGQYVLLFALSVVAIRRSDTRTTPKGEQRADTLIAAVSARAWQRISTGAGAHGPQESGWARIAIRSRSC